MRTALEILNDVQIASPCHEKWSDMTGDERVRHCALCNKDVYNFSKLTAQEAVDLIIAKQGRLCGRLYRRQDGTLLTADCPIGTRQKARRAWRYVVATTAAALGLLLLSGCNGESDAAKTTQKTEKEEIMMGAICPPQRDAQGNPQ